MTFEATNIKVDVTERTLVSDCSFTVAPGEFVGLIGPNGAGKSTLMKSVLGIRDRTAGSVAVDETDFFSLSSTERARLVSFLPQDRRVEWRLPSHNVVMLGRYPHHSGYGGPSEADKAAVTRAMNLCDVEHLGDRPVSVLSGGERSRVLLARALAVEAPFLFVDEPIATLDPYHQLEVMEILQDLSRNGVGILAVVHELALATRFMDRLILMNNGNIVAQGATRDVLTPSLLESVYGISALTGSNNGEGWLLPWSRFETDGASDA